MLRVTTNSTIYTYQKNLLKSTNQLYSAMSAMMSGRNFDSYSADPAAATRAFKIHSSLNATNAQYSNNTTVLNKFSTAWDVADDMIDKLVSDLAQAPALKGLSDTNLSTLNTQGDVIYSGAEAIIQSLNGKYDDNYLFNGADTQNPPFALEQDGDRTYVTYRGVRIDDPATLDQPYTDENGNNVLKDDGVTPMTNREMLEQWSGEHLYVDIGIGFEVDGQGNVIPPPPLTPPSPAPTSSAAAAWMPTAIPPISSPSWCACPRSSGAITRTPASGAPPATRKTRSVLWGNSPKPRRP